MIKTAKIGEARIWTAFSRYSWTVKIWYPSSSERTQSRLFSAVAREGRPHLDGPAVAREGSPDQPQQEREKVDHSYGDPMAVISSSKHKRHLRSKNLTTMLNKPPALSEALIQVLRLRKFQILTKPLVSSSFETLQSDLLTPLHLRPTE